MESNTTRNSIRNCLAKNRRKENTALISLTLVCLLTPLSSNLNAEVTFKDITDEVNLTSAETWKYGGPSVADLDGDGHYEFMLSNHHRVPAQLFWGNDDGSFEEHATPIMKNDVHGIAPGDYDQDGDADLLISLGGGNGTTPQPPRLLRNDDGEFVDVTEGSGIEDMGARGRAVKWIDLDLDGDLDLIQINAAVFLDEDIPRNLMFENIGSGKFRYRKNQAFEDIDAERVLLTDVNGDHIPDLICFTPLSVWQGSKEFNFTDVTEQVLPKELNKIDHVMAAADADIDNDGDLDLYISRGKTYYELANNSLEFDLKKGRLDLRDEGNKSHDGLSFTASGSVFLSDFFRWYRGKEFDPKVFLGKGLEPIPAPESGLTEPVEVTQSMAKGFPNKVTESGWYLGYIGDGKWRFEWLLADDLAWGIRASISGVESVQPNWQPNEPDLADYLLLNENGQYKLPNFDLPEQHKGNNWGVTNGDFNNDGWVDLFVYRFGKLRQRMPDMMLLNQKGAGFKASFDHGATAVDSESNGDMGAAFDFNFDGKIDILSGDDNPGRWHLFENQQENDNDFLLVRVGYSPTGIDPIGAEVSVNGPRGNHYGDTGSAGATHGQSLINTVHFGLGETGSDDKFTVTVRWRDGTEKVIKNVKANELLLVGKL